MNTRTATRSAPASAPRRESTTCHIRHAEADVHKTLSALADQEIDVLRARHLHDLLHGLDLLPTKTKTKTKTAAANKSNADCAQPSGCFEKFTLGVC